MTVRSICFFRYHSSSGILGDLYTVPAGYTLLFKDVHVYNGAGATVLYTVGIRAVEASASMPIWQNNVPANSPANGSLWVVARPGDTVTAALGTGDAWIWLSGSLLLGTPPS